MNIELIMLMTGLALFAYWFNFIMGGPLSDDPNKVDAGAILFFIPFHLAARRLHMNGILAGIVNDQLEEVKLTSDPVTRANLKKDHRLDINLKGRDLFTWEKSLLCPICLHWWLTLAVGFTLLIFDGLNVRADFFLAVFLYLVNHLLIRKIS
jgi:hypothetical protein